MELSDKPYKRIKYNPEDSPIESEPNINDINENILKLNTECTYWDYRLALIANVYLIEALAKAPPTDNITAGPDKPSIAATLSVSPNFSMYLAKNAQRTRRFTVFRIENAFISLYKELNPSVLSKFSANVVKVEKIEHRTLGGQREVMMIYMNELQYKLQDRIQYLNNIAPDSQIIVLELFRALSVLFYLISVSVRENIKLGSLDLFEDFWINSENGVSVILREASFYPESTPESEKIQDILKLIELFEKHANRLKTFSSYYVHLVRIIKHHVNLELKTSLSESVAEMINLVRRINLMLIFQAESRTPAYHTQNFLEIGLPTHSIHYIHSSKENSFYSLSNADIAVSSTILGTVFDIFENYRSPIFFRFAVQHDSPRRIFKEIILDSMQLIFGPSFFPWKSEEANNRFDNLDIYARIDQLQSIQNLLRYLEPISTLKLESSQNIPFEGYSKMKDLSHVKLSVLKLELPAFFHSVKSALTSILHHNEHLKRLYLEINSYSPLSLDFLSRARDFSHLELTMPHGVSIHARKSTLLHLAGVLESLGLVRVLFDASMFSMSWKLKRLTLYHVDISPSPLAIVEFKMPNLEQFVFRYKIQGIKIEIFDIICSQRFIDSFPKLHTLEVSFTLFEIPKQSPRKDTLEADLLEDMEEEEELNHFIEDQKEREHRCLKSLRVEDTKLFRPIEIMKKFGAFYTLEEITLLRCDLQAEDFIGLCQIAGFERLKSLSLPYNKFSQLKPEDVGVLAAASFIKSLLHLGLDFTGLSMATKIEFAKFPYPSLETISLKDQTPMTQRFEQKLNEVNIPNKLYVSDGEFITKNSLYRKVGSM